MVRLLWVAPLLVVLQAGSACARKAVVDKSGRILGLHADQVELPDEMVDPVYGPLRVVPNVLGVDPSKEGIGPGGRRFPLLKLSVPDTVEVALVPKSVRIRIVAGGHPDAPDTLVGGYRFEVVDSASVSGPDPPVPHTQTVPEGRVVVVPPLDSSIEILPPMDPLEVGEDVLEVTGPWEPRRIRVIYTGEQP